MSSVILPANTKIRTTKYGPVPCYSIRSGDFILCYNMNERRGTHAAITDIKELEDHDAYQLMILGAAYVQFCGDTIVYTRNGECRLEEARTNILGTCVMKPNQLLTRQISVMIPIGSVKTMQLFWEGPDYITSEGCLVGAIS